MQPHQERVVHEKAELDEKVEKLDAFMGKELVLTLPYAEQLRLNQQLTVMKKYSDILGERIAAF
jgi:hypothetical protein